ncbi:MAG: hypothetical protein JWP36_2418 [Paucimonas sp.]|nr:hypothetical protein [Paucimonas sp.]
MTSAFMHGLALVNAEFKARGGQGLAGARCSALETLPEQGFAGLLERARAAGLCTAAGEACSALKAGMAFFSQQGVCFFKDQSPGLLDRILAEAILDCLAQAPQDTAACRDSRMSPLQDYGAWHSTAAGTRYFLQPGEGRVVLVINALGIPLRVWAPFFDTAPASVRLCVVDQPPNDAFGGGMRSPAGFDHYAESICDVLAHAALAGCCLLGWSNGARIALRVAEREPARIAQVVLLSPTLRTQEHGTPRSRIEANLDRAFRAITRTPHLAPALSAVLCSSPASDLAAQSRAAASDEEWHAFFALGRQADAADLAQPVSNGESLLHYARRTLADEATSLAPILPALQASLVLVQGESDNVVNNALAREALQTAPGYLQVQVSGAGHYIHSLQPGYLWTVLAGLAAQEPLAGMRLTVTREAA